MKRIVAASALAGVIVLGGTAIASAAAINARQAGGVGWYLIDGNGQPLYTFSADTEGSKSQAAQSHCLKACASAWPPMIVNAAPKAEGKAKASLIATTKRPDGKTQATYNGWPLYTFVGDEGKKGRATGTNVSGFGGTWQLAKALPNKLPPKAQQGSLAALFADVKLKNPECIRYDPSHKRYLISNINGGTRQRDENGFITAVSEKGGSEKWIVAKRNGVKLNAPKGIEVQGGKLYVADIHRLRTFDLNSGKPLASIKVDNATMLNDLAVAKDGTVYVTDTGTPNKPGAVYRVTPDGKASAIARGPKLRGPDGITFDAKGHLVVVSFRGKKVLTMTTGGKILKVKKLKVGKLDGVMALKNGAILVSSWKGRHVVEIQPGGSVKTVVTNVPQPACFTVDEQHHALLVPQVRASKIAVAQLPNLKPLANTPQ